MAHLIDKDAVVAEIEKRISSLESIGSENYLHDNYPVQYAMLVTLKSLRFSIDTIEVKDLNSNDVFIEKAAEWLDNNLWNYYDTGSIGDFEILKFEHFTQMIEDFKLAMKI